MTYFVICIGDNMKQRGYQIIEMLKDSDTHIVEYELIGDPNSILLDRISEDEFLAHYKL